MCFVCFMFDSFPLFSMSILLMLSWWNSIYSTAYACPSMKYLNHRQCGKALSAPTILASVEILTFIFCFRDIFIIEPDAMDIITPVCPLESGCTEKYAPTHRLMKIRMMDLSMSSRCRASLMYLNTPTRFLQSYLSGILTQEHRKVKAILMSFLDLDVKNSSCATV